MIVDFDIEEFNAMIYSCSYYVTAIRTSIKEQGGFDGDMVARLPAFSLSRLGRKR